MLVANTGVEHLTHIWSSLDINSVWDKDPERHKIASASLSTYRKNQNSCKQPRQCWYTNSGMHNLTRPHRSVKKGLEWVFTKYTLES
jgi:hypothetical protein